MKWMFGIGITVLLVLALPACQSWPASVGTGADSPQGEVTDQGKGQAHSGATALRWGGTLLTLTGLGIVASRFLGYLTAPLIGGVLTAGAGVATLTLADLMGRYWWIGPLMLLALIALAATEYFNERDLLWRDPPAPAQPKEQTA